MEIGSRVRAQRGGVGLTQEELARKLAVSHQHVSRIESGHVLPSLELVIRLSQVLGVTIDYLLTGNDRPAVDVRGAIRGEAGLTASAKRHLIGLIDELEQSR